MVTFGYPYGEVSWLYGMRRDAPMGKLERQFHDLISSIRSSWRRRVRSTSPGRTETARKAEAAYREVRSGEAGRRAQEAIRDFRDSETARKATEAVRDLRDSETARRATEAVHDLRDSETARKAEAAVRDFRTGERGRKAEATIQEAEAAARAAYLRLRRSMGDRDR